MAPGSLTCNPGRHQELVAGWFQELHPGIFRYLVRLLDDQESAADLTQETFIRALTALVNQPVPDNPSAWLYRIATNLAYDAMRRRNRLRWLPLTG
ncbi:MAG: RNA polymerase sigma factor, partial [Chloroflexaceae bacterium]|nr:RNA polymerase sigma factor [Chloroflexaceae bacterium]